MLSSHIFNLINLSRQSRRPYSKYLINNKKKSNKVILVSIHNIKCLDYNIRGQGAFDLKNKEFTVENDCFQIKCNEEIGLY